MTVRLEDAAARGMSLRGHIWVRLTSDKAVVASTAFIALLFLAAFPGAWLSAQLLGHGPDHLFYDGANPYTFLPVGPWTHVTDPVSGERTLLILGASDQLGRDEFLRLLYGGRVSLMIAGGATALGLSLGLLLGALAGYFGGFVDTLISRLTEWTMILPQLLIIIALASTVGGRIDNVTFDFLPRGALKLMLLLGFFSWFYPARIVRGQILALRGREFVEAARMIGAGELRILRTHMLPYLVGPLTAYAGILLAQNVLAEAGLSFLGVGINLPTASWGSLLSVIPPLTGTTHGDLERFFETTPHVMLGPALAIFLTVAAFNVLADRLRDALDPHGAR